MAQSTDVNLPRSHTPLFPDRCVRCKVASPRSHVRLITGTLGWWTVFIWWLDKPFVTKAPACPSCARKLHGLRFLSLFATVVAAVIALWFVWPYFKDSVPDGVRKWAMMGLALICCLPQILYEVFYAMPFDVTAYSDSVDYEFTSKDYAVDFAMTNIGADWVKVNGQVINE